MKNKKPYYIEGTVLCLIAVVFVIIALTHPELSFPWANWVSYTIYVLYAVYTILIFLMPRFKGAGLTACVILPVQFVALALIVIYIGTRGTPNESNLYLTIGLILTCFANSTNCIRKKIKQNDKNNCI